MISRDEARQTVRLDGKYVIKPNHSWWSPGNWTEGECLPDGFEYTSDKNEQWLTIDQLHKIVGEHCREFAASH